MVRNTEKKDVIKNNIEDTSKELKDNCIEAMLEKKANNIVCMDLTKLDQSICDTFLICSADSPTQVAAIADNIEEEVLKKMRVKVNRREGDENSIWVILDYSDVIVHVFQTETRMFYGLENLWSDAEITEIKEE